MKRWPIIVAAGLWITGVFGCATEPAANSGQRAPAGANGGDQGSGAKPSVEQSSEGSGHK